MHYFSAILLTFYVLMNNLLLRANGTTHISYINESQVKLEINPQFISGMGHNLIVKKKNESLNLTCTVQYAEDMENDTFHYILDWNIPLNVLENSSVEKGQAPNIAWVWFHKLTEHHNGNYTCSDTSSSPPFQPLAPIIIYLSVKDKMTYCGSQWFKCRSKHCIMERYVCDGKNDCGEGEDESIEAGCGPDPCYGKVLCDDRCIPPEWCCNHRICNTTFGFRPWQPDTNEINYMQTALYHTVIGWAMAFMFIVTLLMIAVCRVHIKRVMAFRWWQQNQNICCRPEETVSHGINMMYNLDSMVRFIAQPVGPPAYSQVVCSPSWEGPPPTYESCEHLIDEILDPRIISENATRSQSADIPSTISCNQNISDSKNTTDISDILQNVPELGILSDLETSSTTINMLNNLNDYSDAMNCRSANELCNIDIQNVESTTLLSRESNGSDSKIYNSS